MLLLLVPSLVKTNFSYRINHLVPIVQDFWIPSSWWFTNMLWRFHSGHWWIILISPLFRFLKRSMNRHVRLQIAVLVKHHKVVFCGMFEQCRPNVFPKGCVFSFAGRRCSWCVVTGRRWISFFAERWRDPSIRGWTWSRSVFSQPRDPKRQKLSDPVHAWTTIVPERTWRGRRNRTVAYRSTA